jgi:hypothetical protein
VALLHYSDSSGDREHPIGEGCSIGRDPESDIILANDRKVSHRHAEVRPVGDRFAIEDLNSRNGTYVERGPAVVRVQKVVTLLPNDVIRIGSTRLTFLPGARGEIPGDPVAHQGSGADMPFEPQPATLMLGKTVLRQGAPPPPPTVVRHEQAPQTDAERIADLERQVAELSAELERLKDPSRD